MAAFPGDERITKLAEFLIAFMDGGRKNKPGFISCTGLLSALVYIAAKTDCRYLNDALGSSLITSFRQDPDTTSDTQEALPLPMAVAAAFERRVCQADAPRWEKLVIGSFLAMTWGGLRFADLQRTAPSSIVLDGHIVRGLTWRSKVTRKGQPFGFWAFGLTMRPPDRGWGIAWLLCMSEWIRTLRIQAGPNIEVDYLLPAIHQGKALAKPMSYWQALRLLRWFLKQPWMLDAVGPVDSPSYTLHLKATATSWALQCRAPENAAPTWGTTG